MVDQHGRSKVSGDTHGDSGRTLITARLVSALVPQLSNRDVGITETVDRFRLLSARQIEALFFSDGSPASRAIRCRRRLAKLTEYRVLDRMERRQGGHGGGSGSYLYAIGPAGHRMLGKEGRPRKLWEPLDPYIAHTLCIAQLYVELLTATHNGLLKLVKYTPEPLSWHEVGAHVLKPDAFTQIELRQGDRALKGSFFVEADMGTESQTVIRQKLDTYRLFWERQLLGNKYGVFPRVIFVVLNMRRLEIVERTIRKHPTPQLFGVSTLDDAVNSMTGVDNG